MISPVNLAEPHLHLGRPACGQLAALARDEVHALWIAHRGVEAALAQRLSEVVGGASRGDASTYAGLITNTENPAFCSIVSDLDFFRPG